MGKFIDRRGFKYGRLIAEEYLGNRQWRCSCICGGYKITTSSSLATGKVKSCGCISNPPIDENFFNVIDNEYKAYILGLFMADGSLSLSPQMKVKLDLKNTDSDVIYKIVEIMQYRLYKPKIYQYDINLNGKIYNPQMCRIHIGNKKIVSDLYKLGMIPNKTNTLDYDILSLDVNLRRHFLRGYFDGNGSISIDKNGKCNMNFTSSRNMNNRIVMLIHSLLNDFTPYLYCRHKHNPNCNQLYITKNKEILFLLQYMYIDCNISITRKLNKSMECISILNNIKNNNK